MILSWNPDGGKLRGTSIADTPLARFALNSGGEDMQENITIGGVSRIWAVSTLPEFQDAGVRVLVGVAREHLLKRANRNLQQALTVLAVVLLLVFAGAWTLSELGIRRQIARINAAVTGFSGGNFSARIGKPYPRGEIGGLMAAGSENARVDGLEVLRRMKGDPELKKVPVVVMTSSREDRDLNSCYDLSINAYVVKPVKFQAFVEAVKQVGAFWALLNELPPGSAFRRDE